MLFLNVISCRTLFLSTLERNYDLEERSDQLPSAIVLLNRDHSSLPALEGLRVGRTSVAVATTRLALSLPASYSARKASAYFNTGRVAFRDRGQSSHGAQGDAGAGWTTRGPLRSSE